MRSCWRRCGLFALTVLPTRLLVTRQRKSPAKQRKSPGGGLPGFFVRSLCSVRAHSSTILTGTHSNGSGESHVVLRHFIVANKFFPRERSDHSCVYLRHSTAALE